MFSQVSLTQIEAQVNTILAWGRTQPTAHTVASLGEFTPAETDALRRMLRSEYQGRNPAVTGQWRTGYEMVIGNERVGVTNGYGSFKIYYRRSCLNGYGRATADQPSAAIPNSWYTVNRGEFTASVDRQTGEVSYKDE